jgi:predicted nucleic acid-binding protein
VILVDSSVWIDHLRVADEVLSALLAQEQVLTHPFVIGEVALGSLRRRDSVIASLNTLPIATIATDRDVMYLIGQHRLFGRGIGYADAHLLAAARLTPRTQLWTRDRRLVGTASDLGLAFRLPH